MSLNKPQTEHELLPPFAKVGDPEWDTRLRNWLSAFDFRFGTASTEEELAEAESRLGTPLPADWRLFLLAFGPLDLGSVQLTPPAQIKTLQDVWFRSHLKEDDQQRLSQFLQVGECGSDNYIACNMFTGWVCECCHDPGGFWDWCPSFNDFLRLKLVGMWSGYFGWPDEEVQALSDRLSKHWLAEWNQQKLAEFRSE